MKLSFRMPVVFSNHSIRCYVIKYVMDAAGLAKIRTDLMELNPGSILDSDEGAKMLYDECYEHIAIGEKYWMQNYCRSVNCGQCGCHAFSGSTRAATACCSTCGCWLHTCKRNRTSSPTDVGDITSCYEDHMKEHQWQSFARGAESKQEAQAAEDVL